MYHKDRYIFTDLVICYLVKKGSLWGELV